MKARDYLVGLGLAKQGARGRFSLDAKRALAKAMSEGIEFSDYNINGMVKAEVKAKPVVLSKPAPKPLEKKQAPVVKIKQIAVPTIKRERIRPETVMYGVEIGAGYQTDLVVAFTNCAACYKTVGYCTCSAPRLPKWIGGGVGMLVRPNI